MLQANGRVRLSLLARIWVVFALRPRGVRWSARCGSAHKSEMHTSRSSCRTALPATIGVHLNHKKLSLLRAGSTRITLNTNGSHPPVRPTRSQSVALELYSYDSDQRARSHCKARCKLDLCGRFAAPAWHSTAAQLPDTSNLDSSGQPSTSTSSPK
jgi:hypothetical protein